MSSILSYIPEIQEVSLITFDCTHVATYDMGEIRKTILLMACKKNTPLNNGTDSKATVDLMLSPSSRSHVVKCVIQICSSSKSYEARIILDVHSQHHSHRYAFIREASLCASQYALCKDLTVCIQTCFTSPRAARQYIRFTQKQVPKLLCSTPSFFIRRLTRRSFNSASPSLRKTAREAFRFTFHRVDG